ncbi:Tap42 interacting protein [Yamadazyma tenuis]|nr:Tap42 interacting protein [Yamadazyma tenuis]
MVKIHTRNRLPQTPPNPRFSIPTARNVSVKVSNDAIASMSSSFPKPTTNISVPAREHTGKCTNPQCAHCGSVIIPAPKSSFPIQDKPSITINDWSIYTIKRPILSSQELDDLEERFRFPLPEMIFGNNSVKLVNDKTKSIIEFNALDALDSIDKSSDLKVSYHQEWLEARRTNSLSTDSHDASAEKALKENGNIDLTKYTDLETIKNYDWTYSTNYKGSITNMEFAKTDEKFPIDRLLNPDPILFFDESILYEDELGDNGISMLSTKIRVMPTCLLLLCRLFLRIDNVIFRIRDTRVFVDFETNKVLREYKEQDGVYNDVLGKISGKVTSDPKSLLRDPNWVSQNIPVLKSELEAAQLTS